MKSYPKVRAIDSVHTAGLFDERGELLIQEKMDGANFRIFVAIDDSGDLTVEFGSRRVSFANKAENNIPKNFQETIDPEEWDSPESQYRDGFAEGIIIRNTHTRTRAKLVTEEFAEAHRSGQRTSYEHDPVDARRMAVKYTGNDRQRIHKLATKLTEDEGHTLEISLMQQLAPRVIEDIGREEGYNILLEDYEVDLHKFRQ